MPLPTTPLRRSARVAGRSPAKIEELRHASDGQAFNIDEEVARLREKLKLKTNDIFKNLTSWQVAQLSRHPARPYTLDYIGVMCEEFHELAGDRMYAEDAAIVAWLFGAAYYTLLAPRSP